MMLVLCMIILAAGAVAAWLLERHYVGSARWTAMLAVITAGCVFAIWQYTSLYHFDELQVLIKVPWISFLNVEVLFAVDNLSLLMIWLTLVLAVVAILISWQEISTKAGFYYFNLLFAIVGILGVFIAMDMFLFFFFWEVMLLPMTALIAIWGHENRHYAATKFFVYTQVSSLMMLIAIIFMSFIAGNQLNEVSFDYLAWQQLELDDKTAFWLMLGFFVAFAVKLPAIPFHSWLPEAHTQAPTAGSVLLAGVLLKTGAYGLIRFVIQLFPEASGSFASVAASLGVISILYGAKMAFSQQDFKRLVAYSSISHMGFVMLALFSFNHNAYQGAILTIVAHGISSAALFCIAGMLYHRLHSRNLNELGGLWKQMPVLAGFSLVFVAAAVGVPGFANFVGEFKSLVGSYQTHPALTLIAALGIVFSAIYGIALFQRSFHGPSDKDSYDLTALERLILFMLMALLILFGLKPNIITAFDFTRGLLS